MSGSEEVSRLVAAEDGDGDVMTAAGREWDPDVSREPRVGEFLRADGAAAERIASK